jgi:signal transduction histidine kinase
MAELIGGVVEVKSAPGSGTTVMMKFTIQAASTAAAPPVQQRKYG